MSLPPIGAALARRVLLIAFCLSGASVLSGKASAYDWTSDDLGAVTEAAIVAARDASTMQAPALMQLANALIRAGDRARAKAVVQAASSSLRANDYVTIRADVVEKLALLGDLSSAETLIANEAAKPTKLMFLGKYGVGRADSSILDSKTIASLSEGLTSSNPTISGASVRAIAEIGAALVTKGADKQALQLLLPLQNEPAKVRVLSQIARILCKRNDAAVSEEAFNQLVSTARLAVQIVTKPYERINIVAMAGDAVASCKGSVQAQTFVAEMVGPDLINRTLGSIVDRLIERSEFALGLSLLRADDLADVENLLITAKRLLKLGDQARATPVALQAAHKAIQGPSASARQKPGWYYDYTGQLSQISAVLADLGAYEEAITVVQPIDANNRAQFYAHAVNAAIQKRDAAGVTRMLPVAIEAFREDSTPGRTIQLRLLSRLTRDIAAAGYRDNALKAFQEFLDVLGQSSSVDQIRQKNVLSAVMLADDGNIQGALASADIAGPMIESPSDAQVTMLAIMSLRLSDVAESEQAKLEAKKMLPSVSGPKAEVLSAVVVHLAKKGRIESALQALAILDAEPSDAVKGVHDGAASALAEAQEKLGDPRGSFATAMRIRQATVRWPVLLKLAGTQPTR